MCLHQASGMEGMTNQQAPSKHRHKWGSTQARGAGPQNTAGGGGRHFTEVRALSCYCFCGTAPSPAPATHGLQTKLRKQVASGICHHEEHSSVFPSPSFSVSIRYFLWPWNPNQFRPSSLMNGKTWLLQGRIKYQIYTCLPWAREERRMGVLDQFYLKAAQENLWHLFLEKKTKSQI